MLLGRTGGGQLALPRPWALHLCRRSCVLGIPLDQLPRWRCHCRQWTGRNLREQGSSWHSGPGILATHARSCWLGLQSATFQLPAPGPAVFDFHVLVPTSMDGHGDAALKVLQIRCARTVLSSLVTVICVGSTESHNPPGKPAFSVTVRGPAGGTCQC